MSDPTQPMPDSEKFAPKNVTEDPEGNKQLPADTAGKDVPRGSEVETRNSSNNRGGR